MRGRKWQRPSSAPRQRKDHDSMQTSEFSRSTKSSKPLLEKATFQPSTYTKTETGVGYDHAQERTRRRARPQSAALSGRRWGAAQGHREDRNKSNLSYTADKEKRPVDTSGLGQRKVGGMIIVKQWRPGGDWNGFDSRRSKRQSRMTKRPQTALGTRRRRRKPGL